MWNPKYPICIHLTGGADSEADEGGKSEDSCGEDPGAEPASLQRNSSKDAQDLPTTIYLFGRTGREKEEWFRHFLFASMDTEWEKERPGRCVSRSGTRHVNNALEKRRLPDKASIQMPYTCGLWITCSNSLHFKADPFRGNRQISQLTGQRHQKKTSNASQAPSLFWRIVEKRCNRKHITHIYFSYANLSLNLSYFTFPFSTATLMLFALELDKKK